MYIFITGREDAFVYRISLVIKYNTNIINNI